MDINGFNNGYWKESCIVTWNIAQTDIAQCVLWSTTCNFIKMGKLHLKTMMAKGGSKQLQDIRSLFTPLIIQILRTVNVLETKQS